jgi:hypothetical protein
MLLLSACGNNTLQIDPQIKPYIDRYVQEAQKVGKTIVVNNLVASLGTLGQADWAGQCVLGGTPTITLSQADWDLFDDAMREQLVFHELGHCVLFRDHNNDLDPYGNPVSIMYWEMSSEAIYTQYRADWLIEMFYYSGPEELGSVAGTLVN